MSRVSANGRIPAAAVIGAVTCLIALICPVAAEANYTWWDVYEYVESLTPGPGEVVWVERCTAADPSKDCYQVWRRSDSDVEHSVKSYYEFPKTYYATKGPNGTDEPTVSVLKGDGTLDEMNVTGSGYYYGGKTFWCKQPPGDPNTQDSGPCTSANTYWDNVTPWPAGGGGEQQSVDDIFTCSGKKRTTPPGTAGGGLARFSIVPKVWWGQGYATGRTAGQCATGDELLAVFNPVDRGGCTVSTTPACSATADGYGLLQLSSCSCLPDGYGPHARIEGACYVRGRVGDPADLVNSATGVTTTGGSGLPGTTVNLTWPTLPGTADICSGTVAKSGGSVDSGKSAGDPVDTATGFLYVTKTDLALPGIVPIAITRTYRSELADPGPFGVGTSWQWDHFLVGSSDTLVLYSPGNRQDQFAVQPNGTFVNTASPALRGAVVTVDATGRTLRFKDGRQWRFDADGWLLWQQDRHGNTVTLTRDAEDRVTAITAPGGRTFTIAYDGASERIATVTDPLGRQVQYTYDAAERLVTVRDPANGQTHYTYDAAHRVLTITDARGITFLTNTYDAAGRVATQTQPDGGVWTFSYVVAADGSISDTTVTDPRGHATQYRFNSALYLIGETDALGHATTFARQAGTNLVSSVTDPLGRITAFTYDAAGNVTAVTDAAGHTTTFIYDATFNLVRTITDALAQVTEFQYDATGNLTRIIDPLGNATTLAYNAAGQPTSVADALTHATTFGYDSAGNLSTIADPLGNTATREYDLAGRLIRQLDPRGKATGFAYDALNQVTRITDALGGTTQFGYDANGNLLALTDARGKTTAYTYDPMDRVASRVDPVNATETFGYDANGNLTQHTDRKGQTATFTHDALNRRTGATYVDATVTYSYDAVGRLLEVTDSAGGSIANTYDALDRLLTQTQPYGTVSYAYDALGRRTEMQAPGVPSVTYGYDAASRLTSITQAPLAGLPPITLASATFEYDVAGRRTRLTLPNQVSTEYQYDAASRLTALMYRNALGALGDLTYAYDAAGNRTSVSGSFARTLLPEPVAAATYDDANRQLTFGSRTLTYDANGNLTGDGVNAYAWDARNRLTTLTGPVPATFTYDALDRRSHKTIAGAVTTILHDNLNPIELAGQDSVTNVLTGLAIDEFLTLTTSSNRSGIVTDALGSTMALADETGATQIEHTYGPFGALTSTGSSQTPFAFTGRENDQTHLYYYRARYYHPTLQRFISEDPIRLNGGPNLYAYVENRPINYIDPLGLDVFIRVFRSAQQPFGHVGLGVNTTATVGFYPEEAAAVSDIVRFRPVPGRVVSDNMPHLTPKETFRIPTSERQDQCLMAFIDQRTANPGSYKLGQRSCGEFVRDALKSCSIEGSGLGGPVSPAGLADRLRLRYQRWP